jgi:tetratricopeptide (TPR) repeat protein
MTKIARVLTPALLAASVWVMAGHAQQSPAPAPAPAQGVAPKPAPPAPAAPAPRPAGPAINREVLEYGNVVNTAAIKGDSVMLAAARLNLKEMIPSAEGPADLRLLYYTAGYASWEFSLQAEDPGDSTGAAYDAAAQLRESIIFDDKYNEAYILAAAIHAKLINVTQKRMAFDPAIGAAFSQAQLKEPKNPRVELVKGIVAFLAPEAFGAQPSDAEESLKRAQVAFAATPDTLPWPNWGKAQTEAWLGQVLAKKGDTAGARAAYQRALTFRPDYAWVKDRLLPALK